MPPAQIRKEQFFRSTCRHLFYYGGLFMQKKNTSGKQYNMIQFNDTNRDVNVPHNFQKFLYENSQLLSLAECSAESSKLHFEQFASKIA